ncbi:MAG: di-heme oxidoredictase family protein, partial [Solirubrobacteraceae bacterium]
MNGSRRLSLALGLFLSGFCAAPALAQLTDQTQTPNAAKAGIVKSLEQEIGSGQGDVLTPGSSLFLIQRDPARAIRRGRQLFQRKFTVGQGMGPRTGDGMGDIATDGSIGAGLVDSCAGCHGRPRGAAGSGGDVATRPDSRDAPHLFGLGLKEMLGDEITQDLRAI